MRTITVTKKEPLAKVPSGNPFPLQLSNRLANIETVKGDIIKLRSGISVKLPPGVGIRVESLDKRIVILASFEMDGEFTCLAFALEDAAFVVGDVFGKATLVEELMVPVRFVEMGEGKFRIVKGEAKSVEAGS
jgi:hypothetical protein